MKYETLTKLILKTKEDSLLSKFKYNYRLSREASVLDKKYVEDKLIRPVTYNLTVGKEKWKLEIVSRAGWSNSTTLYLIFFGGQSLVLLLNWTYNSLIPYG